ncbi:MAG: hypothetical protein K2X66_17905, partial [Cyanobacteria bacterium]|nr:hypothetical protein [Cyanobacteriota bacterium]
MQDKLAPAGKMIASLVMDPNGVHGKVVLEYQPDFTAPKPPETKAPKDTAGKSDPKPPAEGDKPKGPPDNLVF